MVRILDRYGKLAIFIVTLNIRDNCTFTDVISMLVFCRVRSINSGREEMRQDLRSHYKLVQSQGNVHLTVSDFTSINIRYGSTKSETQNMS